MMNFNEKNVLILSPHTDDGELSAGGTITRCIEECADVYYVAFSSCEKSVPKGYDCNILQHECIAATHELGIPKNNIQFFNYEVRDFPLHRQEILEDMIHLHSEIQPDIVITPSSFDVHQDHHVIHMESVRAFKKDATILGMEHPWNNLTFKNDVTITLSKEQLERKISALKQYVSQNTKDYFSSEYITALARTRGLNVYSGYAEVFECIRIIF